MFSIGTGSSWRPPVLINSRLDRGPGRSYRDRTAAIVSVSPVKCPFMGKYIYLYFLNLFFDLHRTQCWHCGVVPTVESIIPSPFVSSLKTTCILATQSMMGYVVNPPLVAWFATALKSVPVPGAQPTPVASDDAHSNLPC